MDASPIGRRWLYRSARITGEMVDSYGYLSPGAKTGGAGVPMTSNSLIAPGYVVALR